jgi:alkylhydroperoxidase family enzyme
MARLPYVRREDLPPEQRHLPRSQSNITQALSNSPFVAHHSGNIALFIREQMRLDPRLKELALIQVGYATGCAYEYVQHVRIGLQEAVSEADVYAIAEETAGRPTSLDPLAKIVLLATREMVAGPGVSAATFEALRKDLDNEELTNLLFIIGNYFGISRVLASLEVDLEPAVVPLLEKFPLRSTQKGS